MNKSSISLLYELLKGPLSVHQLSSFLGLSERRVYELTKNLAEMGLISQGTDNRIEISRSLGGALIRSLSRRYDLTKVMVGSRTQVLASLLSENTVVGVQRYTQLSYPTIRRALSGLMEAGVVEHLEDRREYRLRQEEQELLMFIKYLREQSVIGRLEEGAEVVSSTPDGMLEIFPNGTTGSGSLTAFSVFSRWGIELRTVRDYRIIPEQTIGPEEALVHGLAFSKTRTDYTDCLLFYLKNRERISLSRLRELARAFRVSDAIFDIEAFARTNPPDAGERFLPQNEISEKAKLYDIDLTAIQQENPYVSLIEDLAKELAAAKLRLFVFGGEVMRQRGLKRSTKDIDILLEDTASFNLLSNAVVNLGYTEQTNVADRASYAKSFPRGVFVQKSLPTIDLFTKQIMGAFRLTTGMISRSECKVVGHLSVCLLSNEDILLLKSVTEREGDTYDMTMLAGQPGFNWKIVLNELLEQEAMTGKHFCLTVMQAVEEIERRNGIRTTIHRVLESHCVDAAILHILEIRGPLKLNDMVGVLEYPEYTIRRHANELFKLGKLSRDLVGRYSIKNDR